MREGPRIRGLPVFGFAVAGLLIGHALSYAIAIPDPYHRDLVLERTGHGYLSLFGEAALILLLAGVAALVARALGGGRPERTDRFGNLAGLLVCIQVSAFAGQEVLERVLTGVPLGVLAHDHLLSIGLLVQVAVALCAAGLLRLLARASSRIADVVRPRVDPPRAGRGSVVPVSSTRPARLLLASAANVRGPPPA
ncbi:MAG: hypothetical protein L0206_24610 [Actinobacteria bacterium]|nr:hypothetical protein [Actinomycetota bacterium]